MREFRISEVEPVEWDSVGYPLWRMGHVVGQKDMFTDDIHFRDNPERYPPEEEFKPNEPKIIKSKGIQAALHPFTSQSIRGGTHRGRRT